MIQREKRYVEVDVRFSTEGRLRPLQIIFDKGQVYKIDKIKDICRRAADVGGVGDRYTCMIQGKERELWFEDGRWRRRWSPSRRPHLTHKEPDTASRTFLRRRVPPILAAHGGTVLVSGWNDSYGNHLYFEVMQNSVRMNPL